MNIFFNNIQDDRAIVNRERIEEIKQINIIRILVINLNSFRSEDIEKII